MRKTPNVVALSDRDLIRTLLGIGKERPTDKQTLRDVFSVIHEKKQAVRYEDLITISGVGEHGATKILACFEMGRRYYVTDPSVQKVTKPEDILPLMAYLRDKKQEHFCCVTLNGAGEVLGNRVITIGLLNHSLVHPREVFCDAITDRAASIIVAHNHPSGSLEPSSQDMAITAQLREAGSLIGIQLIDHVIITKTGYLSMRERGLV